MKTTSQDAGSVRNENFLGRARSVPGGRTVGPACPVPATGLPSYRIVLTPLRRHDPININYEEGSETYLPESETIAARLRGCGDADAVSRVVKEELCGSFGSAAVGSPEGCAQIGREIWELWAQS